MKKPLSYSLDELMQHLNNLNKKDRIQMLISEDDQMLWSLFRQGCREALVVLFRKHHRKIVVTVYQKRKKEGLVRLADVQDVFGDFVEKIIEGKYEDVELKKDFTAFAVHHISFLLKDRTKTTLRRQNLREKQAARISKGDQAHLRLEKEFDLEKVINMIPKIGNRVYRMVLYLILIEGYNSKDLAGVFGQSKLAYDKRSRAMKAFRNLLSKEGIWDELS